MPIRYPRLRDRPLFRYLAGVVVIVLAFLLRELLSFAAGPDFSEYVVFYPAVMIVALLAGLGPGLLAGLTASTSLAVIWAIPWQVLPFSTRTSNLLSLGFFTIVCTFLCVVAEMYRRSRLKAAAYDKEQALRESQEALRKQAELLRLSFDAIIVWKMGGGIESWNRGAEELYGFTEAEALSRGIHELLRTAHATPWPEFERSLRERGQWDGELAHVTREGREVIVSSRQHIGIGSDGEKRVLEIDRDITEQKRVQGELQGAHDQLEEKVEQRTADLQKANRMLLMVSACDQALVQMSDEQELIAVICQIIQDEGGYPLVWVGLKEQGDAGTLRCVATAGDRDGFLDAVRARGGEAALADGPPGAAIRSREASVVDDIRAGAEDASWRDEAIARGFHAVAALPLVSAQEDAFGTLVIYAENPSGFEKGQLALLKELVNDLAFGVVSLRARIERDQAQEALEAKAAQLRVLAGELVRTEQRERSRIAQLLHDQLQQLLAAALYGLAGLRTETSSAERRQTVAQLSDLLRECIAMSRSLTSELGHPALAEPDIATGLEWLAAWMKEKHGLEVRIQKVSPVTIATEELRIMLLQAVRELLFNVVKHSGVRTAGVLLDRTPEGHVRITVSDEGGGFDAASLTGPGSVSGGIGLFSIRERLALTGGGLTIDSTPGKGSRVTLWVPAEESVAKAEIPAPPAPVRKPSSPSPSLPGDARRIRILLVDDHAVVREGLALQFRQQPDMEVVGEAGDGAAAVRLVDSLRPDIVTMDVGLPGMSGIEAARRIHAAFPSVGIIGLSMFDDESQASAMREAGAVIHLSKSASIESLLAAIRACAGGRRNSGARTDARRRRSMSRR